MVRRFFALALLLFALPVGAQEQRGGLEGVVKDTQGGVLPGTTVEARHVSSGATFTATTDSLGVYRFPSVPPGIYEVTARLAGFAERRIADVEVLLGQIKKVDFSLAPAGITETVEVRATSPLIDVKQTAKAFSLREDVIELLPKGRDYTSLVVQVPGASSESRFGGGISVDGSSSGENRYIIDGVETTELVSGRQGQPLIVDFVEEVQVKSSGYAAEFGGSTGGVINVITRSGTNQLRGQAGTYVSGSAFEAGHQVGAQYAGGRRTLRLSLTNADVAEYVRFPEDTWTRWEPGAGIGGPLVRDRAWFFGSYQPALIDTKRTVTLLANNQPLTRSQVERVHYASGNVNTQLSQTARLRVATNLSPGKTIGLLPSLDGTDQVGTFYDVNTLRHRFTLSANLDYTVSPTVFLGARAGYFRSNVKTENVPQGPQIWFRTSNIGMPGVPADLQRATGFLSPTTISQTDKDLLGRFQVSADATWFGSLGGHHALKGGVQVDRISNDVNFYETGHRIQIFWGRSFRGQSGPFGYYRLRSNGLKPELGFLRFGQVSVTNVGLFLQDTWTVKERVTLNLGLRTENEHVPAFRSAEGVTKDTAIRWGFKDKLAPRLGVAWDLRGDGRWKAFANWGVFYDIMKLELPRGSFGGEHWLDYFFTLDTPDWTALRCVPPACPGRLILGPVDFRHPSLDAIDPDLDPFQVRETAVGLEHELTPLIGIGVRYLHKNVVKAVEDVGALDEQQNEIYTIANPGFGRAATFYPAGSTQAMAFPKAVRDYDAVEITVRRRLANHYSFMASYLWSRLWGNYSGLAQSDEPGRHSPNVGRVFDYPLMMFDERGRPVLGPLATDRPHQLKAQVLYDFGQGTSVGLFQYIGSGIPVTREATFIPGNDFPVMYKGRLSDGRMPVLTQTDLVVQHEFRLAHRQRVAVNFNVLNLFNQATALDRFRTKTAAGQSVRVSEPDFYRGIDTDALIAAQGLPLDPRFLKDNAFQAPITARLGITWKF